MIDRHLPTWIAITLVLLVFTGYPGSVRAFDANLGLTPAKKELKRALAAASLVLAAKRDKVTNPQDILAAAQADYGRLVGALYEQGYYGPVVSIRIDGREAANIPPLTTLPRVSRVDINVSPGPAFRLGRTEIKPLARGTLLPDTFRPGEIAKTSVIRDAALAGVDGWRADGHAKAQVDQQDIIADHQKARLDVRLHLAPGPIVRFGTLNITGDKAVREKRIREIAGIPPGAVFDPVVMERAATRLRQSGAFSSVTLREADTLGPDQTMDVDLALVDAKPHRFGFGAELQSEEGVTLSGFWMNRNLLGGAERFRIDGEVSGLAGQTDGLDYKLRIGITRPSTINADTDFFMFTELEHLNEPLYRSNQGKVELGFSRYFSKTLTADAGVAYLYSDVRDDLGSRQFSHLALPLAVTWDRRDDLLNPTRGTYLRTEVLPYFGLSNDSSGGRGYLDARAYRGVGANNGVVFAGRLQFGSIVGTTIAQTPPDLLFFSGGSGTVRGHSYQSLGVTSGTIETGGLSFLGMSGEARVGVSEKIAAVAFYDVGYVGANSWIDNSGDWHSGAGLGIRYQTGIGPIRMDVATPITGPGNSGIQVYIGIGQAF